MTDKQNSDYSILVVDDEEIYLSLVKDALEDQGYSVQTASIPANALKIIKSQQVDLLITDIRMPDMTGIQLLKEARKINARIGAIFMTGFANLNTAKDAIKEGAYDYISKPFELNEIRQGVKNALVKIEEEFSGSNTEEQLDRLSDFSQMLIKVGDRRSLTTTSLKFIIMHYSVPSGTAIIWDRDHSEFVRITVCENKTTEELLTSPEIPTSIAQWEKDFQEQTKPARIIPWSTDIETHKQESIYPHWLKEGSQMIAAPIMRGDNCYGFLMIGPFADENTMKIGDYKFLSITSAQLAVSLENLLLLEETQGAYAQLKKLQDETIQLEKMATKGEMSAEIGHELNNFLGVVTGNLSLMEHRVKAEKFDDLDRFMHAINENVDQIRKFTSNLMDLSSISTAKEDVRFDLLITEVIDYLRPQKRFDGVSIKLKPLKHELHFNADIVHIQQLLYNLFNNAADATINCDPRSITVVCNHLNDKNKFAVTIADTGVGFPIEFLNKAFNEKFTTKPTGHGFGLLVCKRIIENHEGELKVDSEPGVGTKIKITFPLSKTTVKALQSA